MNCRNCNQSVTQIFLDLGFAPPSNAYLTYEHMNKHELYYPLKIKVCEQCLLVQTEDYTKASDLFGDDYAYFSSQSRGWLEHVEQFSDMIIKKLSLNNDSYVIEIASNDGYLLKNFVQRGISCLGIEPTSSTADAALKLNIPVIQEFFGVDLAQKIAQKGRLADLLIGNNVYAHIPDIIDFTKGMKHLLKSTGIITLEFPHLLNLIEQVQFDTVYHEHFSYLSLHVVMKIFERCKLKIFDVDVLPTHGGSLRVYGCHADSEREVSVHVKRILNQEVASGLMQIETYKGFQNKVDKLKNKFLLFLIDQKNKGNKVAAYGAAAKGNTFLNYAGVKSDLILFVCDKAISKQGKFLPGSHIPILHPSALNEFKPDTIIILPWNISDEIKKEFDYVKDWNGQFVSKLSGLEF